MTKQITIEEALKLVDFSQDTDDTWVVKYVNGNVKGDVKGDVEGDVKGDVWGNVWGNVEGDVKGDVGGDVGGDVWGAINGQEWRHPETPKEKLGRLIKEGADKEQLLEAFNQLEQSDD